TLDSEKLSGSLTENRRKTNHLRFGFSLGFLYIDTIQGGHVGLLLLIPNCSTSEAWTFYSKYPFALTSSFIIHLLYILYHLRSRNFMKLPLSHLLPNFSAYMTIQVSI
ncbi:hypothetical protein ACJX0J_008897, partial [Zea mays]